MRIRASVLAFQWSVAAWLVGAASPTLARDGVEVGEISSATKLVSAATVEGQAVQQYRQLIGQAQQQRALAPDKHPQVLRLRAIARKLIPYSYEWNPRAKGWQWEVNLINSPQVNAWCMPGGKIAFYTGILDKLKLTDDEVAMVMGHEIAHALREHARERMGKSMGTSVLLRGGAALLGLGQLGDMAAQGATSLVTMKFGRDDESESDLVGMELAARAGYDPRAGVTLWQKMGASSQGAPPQWLSTHPSGPNRIADIQKNLPKVMPLFERAAAAQGRSISN